MSGAPPHLHCTGQTHGHCVGCRIRPAQDTKPTMPEPGSMQLRKQLIPVVKMGAACLPVPFPGGCQHPGNGGARRRTAEAEAAAAVVVLLLSGETSLGFGSCLPR